MAELAITSPSNERIKRLVRLRERRHRDSEGVFVVEGRRLFDRATAAGLEPTEVYYDGSLVVDDERAVFVDPRVLDKASYRQTSQGLIAVFEQFPIGLERIELSSPALLLVLESIEKPGNLGAILRTASAVGADGVISLDDATDVYNPNVLRSSTGALFTVPVATTDLDTARGWLADNSVSLVASSPESPTTLWDADLRRSCAILIGTEDTGLSDDATESADLSISIPMADHGIDSLNASVSAAIIAYEALRQRSIR